MISVQNRLPEPGKENRVSITPDNGSAVEGVLAYADNATQEGTFWNRKTAQLLQGDIRTYPVREGQSISAGDVVNVGKEVISGTTYGDLLVGSTVQINENGSPVDYLVVHQGNPDPDLYDASCDGTWLLRKDIAENRVWDAGNVNAYADSDINDYLNGGWLGRYDSTTLGNIKQVKIPYCVGNGSSTINSGANGLSVKAFFLGGSEVGWSSEDNQYFSADGAKLDFFMASDEQSANQKRIAALNGLASTYALRSPISDANGRILSVLSDGFCNGIMCQYSLGIRPCIICNSSALLGDDIVYGPDTIYKDVVPQDNVENVLESGSVTDSFVMSARDNFNIVGFKRDYNVTLYIVDNNGEKLTSSIFTAFSLTSAVSSCGIYKLSENEFVVYCICSTNLYAKIGTISGTSISFGSQYTVASSVSNSADIIVLSDTIALAIYNSSGLKCKVLPISGTTITTSGTEYSLSGITGANYISACRLPDEGGNKRVCICCSDTGDGNKGKAVIATINSSNAVTFGDVKTIRESTTVSVSCVYLVDTIYCIFATDIYALNESLMIVATKPVFSSYAANSTFLIPFDDFVIAVNGSGYSTVGNGAVYAKLGSSATIDLGDPYMFYGRSAAYCSGVAIAGDKALLAYADTQNSNYGTTTILEVSGNQIAGSFLDNSSDAIALADGTGGQEIPVGFGGYCECSNVYEGEMIDSNGIRAVAVKNGWLHITPQYKNAAFGSFVYNHDAEPTKTVNLGFKPSIVLIYNGYNNTSEVAISGSPGDGNHIPMVLTRLYTSGNSYISDDGFVFYSSLNSSTNSNLYYVAFR